VRHPRHPFSIFLLCLIWSVPSTPGASGQDPKQTKDNTISIEMTTPVVPQKFSRPVKFFVVDVIDRSGDPQPMLVMRDRGGIYLDRQPAEIVKEALERTLKGADLLAEEAASSDYTFTVYIFHFGLASGSGFEFFGKFDLAVMVKDVKTGKSEQVTAMGASIQDTALRKKNVIKNVKANLESALADGLRNFLRGQKLRDVVGGAAF
jgi:hypothetical protein